MKKNQNRFINDDLKRCLYYFSIFFFLIKHTEEFFSCEKYAISLYQNMRFSG